MMIRGSRWPKLHDRKLHENYHLAGQNWNKSDNIIIGNKQIEFLELEKTKLKGVETCKYLDVKQSKDGNSHEKIEERMNNGRKVIKEPKSIPCNKELNIYKHRLI